MFRNGIRRVVYVSTASVYPEMDGFIREDQLDLNQEPHAAYLGVGWAKRYGEKACQFWHEKTGLEVMILRLANIFGPFARFDPRTSNFIPALIRKAVDGMDPFEVWGSPSVVRDVIYADDFGTAVVAALAATELKFDAFNIGSGTLTSVGSVVEAALSAANFRPSGIKYGEPTTDTLPYRVLDVSRAKRLLNWTPAVGPIEGIVRTVDWWKRNRDTWIR
jgi:nucleoside-diphosphate-sugar epimerase